MSHRDADRTLPEKVSPKTDPDVDEEFHEEKSAPAHHLTFFATASTDDPTGYLTQRVRLTSARMSVLRTPLSDQGHRAVSETATALQRPHATNDARS
jgi:hypothetical protein